ncbi:MAG: DUF1049 domain-containing protein [Deltaproteobacteria bacterium]|nr:DUF1049 domain-containing protein [Deltaproteobacteria bacterium]
MRKLKLFLAIVFLGVFGLLIFENRTLFGQWYAFDFNFIFYKYRAPEVVVGVYFIAVFLMGFLIAYFSGLMDQYRFRRNIRRLEKQLAVLEKEALAPKSDQETGASGKTSRAPAPGAATGDAQSGPSS